MNKVNKETCEKVISKHFHKGWKNSYIGLIWKNLKDNTIFCVTNRIGIIKYGSEYNIFFSEEDIKNV